MKLSILTIFLTVTTSVNSKVVDHKVENSELSVNVNDGSGDEYFGVVVHGNEKRDDDDGHESDGDNDEGIAIEDYCKFFTAKGNDETCASIAAKYPGITENDIVNFNSKNGYFYGCDWIWDGDKICVSKPYDIDNGHQRSTSSSSSLITSAQSSKRTSVRNSQVTDNDGNETDNDGNDTDTDTDDDHRRTTKSSSKHSSSQAPAQSSKFSSTSNSQSTDSGSAVDYQRSWFGLSLAGAIVLGGFLI